MIFQMEMLVNMTVPQSATVLIVTTLQSSACQKSNKLNTKFIRWNYHAKVIWNVLLYRGSCGITRTSKVKFHDNNSGLCWHMCGARALGTLPYLSTSNLCLRRSVTRRNLAERDRESFRTLPVRKVRGWARYCSRKTIFVLHNRKPGGDRWGHQSP